MKALALALTLVVLVVLFALGCAPIETDDPQDPQQALCERRGGDYLCRGFHPDGSLDCLCVIP